MKVSSLIIASLFVALAAPAFAQEPTPMPKEYHDQLSRFAGEWNTEVTVDGHTLKGTFSCKMAPGGECLIYHSNAPGLISTDTIIHGTGIIGWDPAQKQLKEVNFNSLGETSTTMWTFDKGQFKGVREGVVLGMPSKSKVENHWVEDGQEWQHHINAWQIGTEKQDNVVITFRRTARK